MIVRSHQNYLINSNTGFDAQLLKNKTTVAPYIIGRVIDLKGKNHPLISSREDWKPLKKHDSIPTREWSVVGSIGGVTEPIVEDRPVISSWPDWKPLKKHDSISTVEWLRDKWGADGTFDLPNPDQEIFDKAEIEKWARSNDALIRTVGRICLIILFINNDHSIYKSRMQEPSDGKFWKDYEEQRGPRGGTHQVERPGKLINLINWNDIYERAQEANSRFDWFKKNWGENDKKLLLENKTIPVSKKYWKMISDLFPTEPKDENGYINLTKDKINVLLNNLTYSYIILYNGYDPGMEAYARYLNWLHDSIGWNDWSINNGV